MPGLFSANGKPSSNLKCVHKIWKYLKIIAKGKILFDDLNDYFSMSVKILEDYMVQIFKTFSNIFQL